MTKFSPAFYIGTITIGTVEGASCVNLGNNLPSGFTNYKKHNQGFGNISGNHTDVHDILARLEEKDSKDIFGNELENDESSDEINEMVKDMIINSEFNIEEEYDDEDYEEVNINKE